MSSERKPNAEATPGCEGCQWRKAERPQDFCGMLGSRPDNIPCAQHDKFEPQRRANAQKLRGRGSMVLAAALIAAAGWPRR